MAADALQKQLLLLHAKVDALHQLIEQLNAKVEGFLADGRSSSSASKPESTRLDSSRSSHESLFTHRDILGDTPTSTASEPGSDKKLMPEVQIQRLTAQLTAAYNRIAALEEQLLAQRIH